MVKQEFVSTNVDIFLNSFVQMCLVDTIDGMPLLKVINKNNSPKKHALKPSWPTKFILHLLLLVHKISPTPDEFYQVTIVFHTQIRIGMVRIA